MSSKQKYSPGLLFAAFTTGILGTLSHGYQNTVFNNIESLVKNFVNSSLTDNYGVQFTSDQITAMYSFLIVGMWAFGAILGGFFTNFVIEIHGRKYSLLVWNNLLVFLGGICFVCAPVANRFELLVLGRFLFGLANSVFVISFSLYITESAPDDKRGILSTYRFIFHITSCILGQVLGLPQFMGTDHLWPFLIALGFIPAFLLLMLTPLFWETPKFLYMTKNSKEKASAAILHFHGENADLDRLFLDYDRERSLMAESKGRACEKMRETFVHRHLRIPFILAILLNLGENTGGHDAILNYSSELFVHFGFSEDESKIASVCCLLPGFVGAVFATFTVERMGRRKLVMMGLTMALIGCSLLFVCEFLEHIWQPAKYGSLIGSAMIVFAFFGGLGPIAEFIFGEITPVRNHGFAGAWSLSLNWVASCFYASTFSSLHDMIGPWSQLYFIIPTAGIMVYTYRNLPETKGRPVDEIVATWIKDDVILKEIKGADDDLEAVSFLQ